MLSRRGFLSGIIAAVALPSLPQSSLTKAIAEKPAEHVFGSEKLMTGEIGTIFGMSIYVSKTLPPEDMCMSYTLPAVLPLYDPDTVMPDGFYRITSYDTDNVFKQLKG